MSSKFSGRFKLDERFKEDVPEPVTGNDIFVNLEKLLTIEITKATFMLNFISSDFSSLHIGFCYPPPPASLSQFQSL